jgi:hypothetical protein
MSTNNVEICTEDKTFHSRGEWDEYYCREGEHKWKILVFCGDYTPSPGIAICTKCAFLDGGWVRDKVIE